MKRPITYGDLGSYLSDRHEADKKDTAVAAMRQAWNKFADLVPGIAATRIDDEVTDKIVKQFKEAAQGCLRDSSARTYVGSFRKSVRIFEDHVEATGEIAPPARQPDLDVPQHRPLTYGDMREWLQAFREDNPDRTESVRRVRAYDAVAKRVPETDAVAIDPEATEQLMEQFAEAAAELKRSTMNNYQNWFRHAVVAYCDACHLEYVEIDAAERRRKSERAKAEADQWDQAEEDDDEEDEDAVVDESSEYEPEEEAADDEELATELTEYVFLLRPDVLIPVPLPDDFTRAEAKRFGQWLSAYVVD